MSDKEKISVKINRDLYLNSKNYLDMSLDSFIEYSLSLYIQSNDNYARLFKRGCKLYNELDKIKNKLYDLENKKNDKEDYTEALITINRIHDKLGYVGKNQMVEIEFVRYLQTAAGKMMFAKLTEPKRAKTTKTAAPKKQPSGRRYRKTK